MPDQDPKPGRKLGPHGYGDPDDRTLRKSEKNILIPQRRRQLVRDEYCPNEIKAYEECVCQAGLVKGPLLCKELKIKMSECLVLWNDNDDVQRKVREDYLKERSDFRRTGICKDDRKFMADYFEAKKNEKNTNS